MLSQKATIGVAAEGEAWLGSIAVNSRLVQKPVVARACGAEQAMGQPARTTLLLAYSSNIAERQSRWVYVTFMTRVATSTRLITPLAMISSVRIAAPVDGSDFNPPGLMIVQS